MTSIMRDRFDEDDEEWTPADGQTYPPLSHNDMPQQGSQEFAKMLLDHLKMVKEEQAEKERQMAQHNQAAAILPIAARAANGLGTIRGKTPDSGGLEHYFGVLQQARAAQEANRMKNHQMNIDVLKYLEGIKQKREMANEALSSRERMMGARRDDKELDRYRGMIDKLALKDYDANIQAGLIDRRHNLESPSVVPHEDLYKPLVRPGQKPEEKVAKSKKNVGNENLGFENRSEDRPSGRKLSAAQTKIDSDFAKNVYTPFMYEGKYAQDLSAIDDLRKAASKLRADPGIGGGGQGMASRSLLLGAGYPGAQDVKDQVENAVKTSLKTILGGQFTEQEGARIFALAYNPSLSSSINIARIEKLAKILSRQFQAKVKAAEYYEKYKTLDGFRGSEMLRNRAVVEDLDKDLDKAIGIESSLQPEKPQPELKMKNREIVKKLRNKKTGEIKIIFSDGTEEVLK